MKFYQKNHLNNRSWNNISDQDATSLDSNDLFYFNKVFTSLENSLIFIVLHKKFYKQ